MSASVFRFCSECSTFHQPPYVERGNRDEWTTADDGSWVCPDCRENNAASSATEEST